MINKRRGFLQKLLAWDRKSARDLKAIERELQNEPGAKHRQLRSHAKINRDDVAEFSAVLKQEYPALVYFLANYKIDEPGRRQFPGSLPIVIHGSLLEAVKTASEDENMKKSSSRPNWNRPNIFVRWPWPEELVSGDRELLIGGRYVPDDTFRLAAQYRDEGRWFLFNCRSDGYIDPKSSQDDAEFSLHDRSRLRADAYPRFDLLAGRESEFFTFYDLNDPETTAFAKHAHALWRRIATKDVAVYDPISRNVVDPEGWSGRHWRSIGKRALAGALETPPRYADFAFLPSDGRRDGPALMVGPKPKRQKKQT